MLEKQQAKNKSLGQQIVILWIAQFLLLLLSVLGFWWLNPTIALSVLVGGLIYLLPNAYFTLYAFRFRGSQQAILILRSIYRGEVGKLILTGLGFALAFIFLKPIDPVALFIAYGLMTLSQWIIISRLEI